ncbi:MAG: cyclic nucleotide-binding domain-containing protein, partial [Polyangiales bacterium]
MEVQRLGPGEHFGELALVVGAARAADVIAETDLELARLSHASYLTLHERHPDLGRRLLEATTAAVASRLSDVSDGISTLLRERSLPRRAVIAVRVCGAERSVHPGTRMSELLPGSVDHEPVIAGLLDRKAVSLATRVTSSCAIEPLTQSHWEGQRIYRHSLGLLLLEAAYRVDPSVRLVLDHSVGFGQRVSA